jgi:hypothetical protein
MTSPFGSKVVIGTGAETGVAAATSTKRIHISKGSKSVRLSEKQSRKRLTAAYGKMWTLLPSREIAMQKLRPCYANVPDKLADEAFFRRCN